MLSACGQKGPLFYAPQGMLENSLPRSSTVVPPATVPLVTPAIAASGAR